MSAATWLVLAATGAILAPIDSYSTGAPKQDCWTDRPFHGNNMPSHEFPPYQILLSDGTLEDEQMETYQPGKNVYVTIKSRDGTPFKGYLMKLQTSSEARGGTWGVKREVSHALGRCGVTHNNGTNATEITIAWKAPTNVFLDNIQFKAIVVKNFTTFYNNVLSKPLRPAQNNVMPTLEKLLKHLASFNLNLTLPNFLDFKLPSAADLSVGVLDSAPVQPASGSKGSQELVAKASKAV